MNRITLTGNVGRSATSRATQNGGFVNFSLAVSKTRKNDKGEWETIRTDWFDCVVYTSTADGASKLGANITVGTKLLVAGEMQSHQYEKDGIKRTAWSVRVDELEFIGGKKDDTQQGQQPAPQQESQEGAEPAPTPEPEAQQQEGGNKDDLPF